jgi:hypothetical protein
MSAKVLFRVRDREASYPDLLLVHPSASNGVDNNCTVCERQAGSPGRIKDT